MSKDHGHPPHTRARLSQAGLLATGIMTSALVIGLVSSAPASPSSTTHPAPPPQQSHGLGNTVAQVANTAENAVAGNQPLTGRDVFAQISKNQEAAKTAERNFLNTVAWNATVAKNLAFEHAVAGAEAAAEAAAAAKAAASYSPGTGMTGSVASMFSCIRNAESGGNYSAVNASSGAGGAYQFMPSTWASLGGTGLPQDAPPAEQDAMALKLYQRDGWSPWAGDGCVG